MLPVFLPASATAIVAATVALTPVGACVSLLLPVATHLCLRPLPIFMEQKNVQMFAQHANEQKYIVTMQVGICSYEIVQTTVFQANPIIVRDTLLVLVVCTKFHFYQYFGLRQT